MDVWRNRWRPIFSKEAAARGPTPAEDTREWMAWRNWCRSYRGREVGAVGEEEEGVRVGPGSGKKGMDRRGTPASRRGRRRLWRLAEYLGLGSPKLESFMGLDVTTPNVKT